MRDFPELRELGAKDAPALHDFYACLSQATLRTFRPLGATTSLEVCQRIVEDSSVDPSSRIDWVAWHATQIVGWASISPLEPNHLDLGVCVAEAFQNRGIGTALLTQTLRLAQVRRFSPVYLMVVQDNQRAIRWYERHGFSTYGEEFDQADQLHYFHMVKRSAKHVL